ncbi:8366_t:CDS:10, partial [Cetraspora pellucida]
MSIAKEKSMSWSSYFDVTPPEDYSFLEYYRYRSRQTDFIPSFKKESHKLKKDLENVIKDGVDEKKKGARRLEEVRRVNTACQIVMISIAGRNPLNYGRHLRVVNLMVICVTVGHRKYFKDVNAFWNQIERLHAEFEASSSVIQDTIEVFKNSVASVNSSIKNVNNIMLQYNENLKDVEIIDPNFENARSVLGKRRNSMSGDYDSLTENDGNESPCEKKQKNINKGKQPESKSTERYDKSNDDLAPATMMASSLNSISNNITMLQDSSILINQEQLPTAIVTNPAIQTSRTPPPRPNLNNANIQVTPQKSVLFKESITYLQNHIKLNVNDQGMIIKDNHTSIKISNIIRNWLITALSSTSEEFVKAIMTPLSSDASPLKRNIGERTFIVERIVPLFKAIQSVYKEYKFHWIEIELDCMREVKRYFQKFDLTINQADGIGVRNSTDKAVIFIEVSGGPENTDLTHVKEDAEKLLKEAVFGLVSLLRNHLDKSAEVAKSLYTFTIQSIGDQITFSKLCLINKHVYSFSQIKSARLPFEFIDVADFLEIFELLYIIISELEIQTSVINKLKLSESVDSINVPKIRDWIWVPDSVSAWK